jgi:hypothetical protein
MHSIILSTAVTESKLVETSVKNKESGNDMDINSHTKFKTFAQKD